MASIGELFIQLGVLGNANELRKANLEFQKANILAKKQAKLEKLRAEYLEKINKAQDKAEKRKYAQQYKEKKRRIEQEATLRTQLAEKRALKGNIAQWASYAHVVSMSASLAVNAIKKVYTEIEKITSYGQNMLNIGMTTSIPLGMLQAYGRVAHALNPKVSEAGLMQQLARINQAYDLFKAGIPDDVYNLFGNNFHVFGKKSQAFFTRALNPNATAVDFIEGLRDVIQGEAPERQVNLLRNAGLGEELLPLLRLSREDFEAKKAEMMQYALTEDQLEEQAKTAERINVFKQHFEDFTQHVYGTFTPLLERMIKKIEANLPQIFKWVEDNLPVIKKKAEELINFLKSEEVANAINGLIYVIKWIATRLGFDPEAEKAKKSMFYNPETNKMEYKEGRLTEEQERALAVLNGNLARYHSFSDEYVPGSLREVDFKSLYLTGKRNFGANPIADAQAGFMSPINIENVNLNTTPQTMENLVDDTMFQCGLERH